MKGKNIVVLSAISAVVCAAISILTAGAEAAILGGFVPHHDLAMDMIREFYTAVAEARPDGTRRVWLLSPDHFRRSRRYAALRAAENGPVSTDAEAASILSGYNFIDARAGAFDGEHGVNVHIPLIAEFFPGASVVPLLIRGDMPDVALLSLKNAILSLWRPGDVMLVSMDMSHYLSPEGLLANDLRSIEALTGMRAGETRRLDVDQRRGAALALMVFRALGAEQGELLARSDTSAVTGERVESGTGYATIIYQAEARQAFRPRGDDSPYLESD